MLAQKNPPTPSTLTKQDSRSRDASDDRAREIEREQEMPAEVFRPALITHLYHVPVKLRKPQLESCMRFRTGKENDINLAYACVQSRHSFRGVPQLSLLNLEQVVVQRALSDIRIRGYLAASVTNLPAPTH